MWNKWIRAASLGALALASACSPEATTKLNNTPADDAGNEAFVRNAIPALLGRQPLGSQEVYGLLEILKVTNRAKIADLLMARPEFREYWATVLIGALKPELSSPSYHYAPRFQDCYTAELLGTAAQKEALATSIRTATPDTLASTTGSFRDVVEGAISLDHLSPIYAAWPAMMVAEKSPDSGALTYFMLDALVNRRHECMDCHTSGGSPTNSGPDRHFPHMDQNGIIELEWSLFPAGTSAESLYAVEPFLRKDAGPATNVGNTWGLYCSEALSAPAAVADLPYIEDTSIGFANIYEPTGRVVGTAQVISAFKSGVNKLANGTYTVPETVDFGLYDGEAAFAYAVASNVVDAVVEEVTGSRLTLIHGFSRTAEQRAVHARLTSVFLGDNPDTPALEGGSAWSLKGLLKAVVTSKLFNRRAPKTSPQTAKYKLPMITNPWVYTGETPDETAGTNANGQGDLVARRSAIALISAWSASVGGGSVSPFATQSGTPTFLTAAEYGQHVSYQRTANRASGLNFQLAWAERGNPSLGTWDEALDAKLKPAGVWHTNKYRYTDLAIAVKDRVLGQPTLTTAEKDALKAFWSVPSSTIASMTDYVSQTWYEAYDGRSRVLKYMALLQETPQFLLSGLPPAEVLPAIYPDPTKLDVCTGSQPCSVSGWISDYKSLGYSGAVLTCVNHCPGTAGGGGGGPVPGRDGFVTVNGAYCYCDYSCAYYNDCCYDKYDVCP